MARDVTLDGNTFARSRSVDKRIFQQIGAFGLSFTAGKIQTSFSYVMRGKEFSGQQKSEDYGSLLLSWKTE